MALAQSPGNPATSPEGWALAATSEAGIAGAFLSLRELGVGPDAIASAGS